MEKQKPIRTYIKKLTKIGNSSFILLPLFWLIGKGKKVWVKVYRDKIIIEPIK